MLWLLSAIALADAPAPVALPDLEARAERGRCEIAGGRRAAGADQTYVGRFTLDAAGVATGTEKRLLFANEAYKAVKGEDGERGRDCVNVWTVTGVREAPVRCADCTFSLRFEANIDYPRSTCPQRLVVDGNHFRTAYDVREKPDGTLDVFFTTSEKRLATGYFAGGDYVWISEHRCVWL